MSWKGDTMTRIFKFKCLVDGCCFFDEGLCSCPVDCKTVGALCGDSCCDDSETCDCVDCPTTCGDGCCAHEEDSLTDITCPADCPDSSFCGDEICLPEEEQIKKDDEGWEYLNR